MDLRRSIYRIVARLLILFMIIQGMPLSQISQAYPWQPDSEKIEKIFDFLALGLSEAHAAQPVAAPGDSYSAQKNLLLGAELSFDGSASYDPDSYPNFQRGMGID